MLKHFEGETFSRVVHPMLFLSHNRYVALPLLCLLVLWTVPWPVKQAKQAKSRPAKELLLDILTINN